MLPAITHQALHLQLLQVVPGRVQRDTEPDRQLARGHGLGALELSQHCTPLAFVADGPRGFAEGQRGAHDGGMLSNFVGIVKSCKNIGANR